MLLIVCTLRDDMIFFYPELIENRGGISILHHFKERFMFIVRRAFFVQKFARFFYLNLRKDNIYYSDVQINR